MITHAFYKEEGIWFIDLPEFLEFGFGTLANLMMVDGSDTFLDYLSNGNDTISITMSPDKFEGYQYSLIGERVGLNKKLLALIGHAPVDEGKYYTVLEHNNHRLWLCPVTKYVFSGFGSKYPECIYIKVNN